MFLLGLSNIFGASGFHLVKQTNDTVRRAASDFYNDTSNSIAEKIYVIEYACTAHTLVCASKQGTISNEDNNPVINCKSQYSILFIRHILPTRSEPEHDHTFTG